MTENSRASIVEGVTEEDVERLRRNVAIDHRYANTYRTAIEEAPTATDAKQASDRLRECEARIASGSRILAAVERDRAARALESPPSCPYCFLPAGHREPCAGARSDAGTEDQLTHDPNCALCQGSGFTSYATPSAPAELCSCVGSRSDAAGSETRPKRRERRVLTADDRAHIELAADRAAAPRERAEAEPTRRVPNEAIWEVWVEAVLPDCVHDSRHGSRQAAEEHLAWRQTIRPGNQYFLVRATTRREVVETEERTDG